LKVGGAVQQIKKFLEKRAAATSALARALLTEEKTAALAALQQAKAGVQAAMRVAQEGMDQLDQRWPEVSAEELSALASEWNYLGKWRDELAEWEFRLTQE